MTAFEMRSVALVDMLFFFGVLLVGFAYLWRFGYLDWVRSAATTSIKIDYRPGSISATKRESIGRSDIPRHSNPLLGAVLNRRIRRLLRLDRHDQRDARAAAARGFNFHSAAG